MPTLVYTSLLLLLLLYAVSAVIPNINSWIHSKEFTTYFNMYQLSWPNKSALTYDGLIDHFIRKAMERHHEDRLHVKNFGRNFTCIDGSQAALSTYNGVIEGLKMIGHRHQVRLKKCVTQSFRLRATLTIQPLTVKYNYFLNVQTEDGKSFDFNGTVFYSVGFNILNVDFKFTLDSHCKISMERPVFLQTEDYVYNITGLEGSNYVRDLENQFELHFIMKLRSQIEIFYHFLFAKVENKNIMSAMVYNAFSAYYQRTAVDTQRKKYHPKSIFRSIYLNRKKGYHLDKYGKNMGTKKTKT